MVAIITDQLRKVLVQHLFDENSGLNPGDSDNYYYITVGRSQSWQPDDATDISPTPANTERERRKLRYDMQSVIAVDDYSFVIPLHDWSANSVYNQFNDNVVGQPSVSYYVRTEDNNVYMCIRTGKDEYGTVQVSTVKPDHTDTTLPIEDDGYVWKFLYTITTANANRYLTGEYMPVAFIDSALSTDPTFSQYSVQNAAVAGQIVGYRVTTKGGVYTSAPSVSIQGNGTGARAKAILNTAGGVEAIEIDDSNGAGNIVTRMGSGYDYANVVISSSSLSSGGTAAKAVPVFAAPSGMGADARDDRRSTAIMFNVKPEGSVNNDWIVDNDYRQIGILRNPTDYGASTLFTDASGIAQNRMTLTLSPGDGAISYAADIKVTGTNTGAEAWLDYYDDSATLWYHQDENTGFVAFQDGEVITVEGYTASTLTISQALVSPDLDKFTGDLLFIDNKSSATTRDADQTEDIKLVIKL